MLFFLLFSMGIYYYIINFSYKYLDTSNITNVIKKSTFAGNAFFINKKQLLTTYNLVESTCKKNEFSANLIYILYKGKYYQVIEGEKDVGSNLAILLLKNIDAEKLGIKNYALLSNQKLDKKNNNIFYYNNRNEPYKQILTKTKINEFSINQYFINSFDVFREKQGTAVLDKNYSLAGIITDRTKNGLLGIFSNRLTIISTPIIEKFFQSNNIEYNINKKQYDLSKVNNYINDISVQVICFPDITRVQTRIKYRAI